MTNIKGRIILFDSECKLCSAWVPFVIKRDLHQQFKFCSVQSPKGQQFLESFGLDTQEFETMVLIKNGHPIYKSEAFFNITKHLENPWPMLNLLRVFPLAMRDWLYDRVALNRYKIFGRHNFCMIPTKAIQQRFID
ncbi:thiol-disulfide oxidoreductase DCC family protein [Kangiella sp. HZ709]|uniref:thiol-disulfide oxidoreductase DCC family protein n=1 Tax=Kangiella sp. HZ709 TaxID=2666328 RepID=UPI00351B4AE9